MRAYRALWWSLAAPLGVFGVVCAAAASAAITVVIVFVMATLSVAAVSANLQSIETSGQSKGPVSFSTASTHGVAGGGIAVCLFGFGHLTGIAGIALVGLMVVSSPAAVRLFRGTNQMPKPAERRHSESAPARSAASPGESEPLFDDMTNAALCMAWRRSFVELTNAKSPANAASVAAYRQLLLDELERRSPGGFAEWIASGARAASDPTKYLRHGSDAGDLRGNDSVG